MEAARAMSVTLMYGQRAADLVFIDQTTSSSFALVRVVFARHAMGSGHRNKQEHRQSTDTTQH